MSFNYIFAKTIMSSKIFTEFLKGFTPLKRFIYKT